MKRLLAAVASLLLAHISAADEASVAHRIEAASKAGNTVVWGRATVDRVPLPGTMITLRNAEGFVIGTRVTDINGEYIFTAVPRGSHTVTGELSGLKTGKPRRVNVTSTEPQFVAIRMKFDIRGGPSEQALPRPTPLEAGGLRIPQAWAELLP